MYFRATFIAVLLIFDSSIGFLRSIPPISFFYLSIILIIITGWWIWKTYYKRGLPRTPITIPIIIFYIVVILSTFFSINQRKSLDGLIATTTVIMLIFLFCDLLLSGWDPRTFEIALLIFTSYLLVQGMGEIINWFTTWISLSVPEYPIFPLEYRLYGVTAHPNLLAALIYMTIPFVIIRLSKSKSKILTIGWIIWLLIADVVFYFTNSRGGIVSILFVLIVTIGWIISQKKISFHKNIKLWLKSNRYIFGLLLVYIGVFGLLYIFSKDSSSNSSTLRHGAGITAGRLKFWEIAINSFLENPVLGTGPSTYAISYINQLPSGIYGWIAPHAHNFYLNTLAELGFLGIIALGGIILGVIWSFYSFLRKNTKDDIAKNVFIVCTGAALIGICVHSSVDVLTWIPHITIPIIMLLVLGLFATNNITPGKEISSRWMWLVLVIPLVIGSLSMRLYYAISFQVNSIQAGYDEDWIAALNFLESANEYDPNLKFYYEQLGYALGAYSTKNINYISEEELSKAIQSYEIANDIPPIWAPNYVNLAELQNFAGYPEEVLLTLESIPKNWLNRWKIPQMLLAEIYYEVDRVNEGILLYRNALTEDNWLIETAMCQRSKLCRRIADQIILDPKSEYSIHYEAIDMIKQGHPRIALGILDKNSPDSSSALIWVDRAAAHCALNEYPQCEYSLAIAKALRAENQAIPRSFYVQTKSNFLIHNNSIQEAINILESDIKPLVRIKNYENIVHNRIGFPEALLPSISILENTPHDLENLYLLKELYIQEDRLDEAAWVEEQISALSIYFQ